MKHVLLWIATALSFVAAAVTAAALLLWLSVGGTFFRGQEVGVGTVVGMGVLAATCAACAYGGLKALRASRRV